MTTYKLVFRTRARKAFDRLDKAIRRQFSKKLAERLNNPRVPAHKLRSMPDCYRINLRSAGFRLIYRVEDDRMVVLVIAVASCADDEAYDNALIELSRL